ncbi:hypothetical protein RB595_005196 [Gaeumannomyces hyphopodioides]
MNPTVQGSFGPPKQIRFVNNEGNPPSKRRRINAACLTCRRRKTRCSGEPGICSTCSKNGHECLGYNETIDRKKAIPGVPKKRTSTTDGDLPALKNEGDYLADDNDQEYGAGDAEGASWDESDNRSFESTESKTKSKRHPLPSHGQATAGNLKRSQSNDWHHGMPPPQQQPLLNAEKPRGSRTVSFFEDRHGPSDDSATRHRNESNRIPYFRYFGRTAIVPGFKQMLANVSYRGGRRRGSSFSSASPRTLPEHRSSFTALNGSTAFENGDGKPSYDLGDTVPAYDPSQPEPIDPLIVSLIETFFTHLGCNYPFLRREKIIRMVREKKVESMLVDVMCALATRFADFPLRANSRDPKERAEYGNIFAQRAKAATVDAYPCPTVGAVQAYLLLAYECFGQDQDSALWMYLGNAIRMADDLGLHRTEGVKYQGEKDAWYTRTWNIKRNGEASEDKHGDDDDTLSPEEQSEVEQERIDTFWAVFVLDRVISSGTGRPVRYKDGDFEIPLPEPAIDPVSNLPDPFPFFIRIIHLYGRASDVLNNVTDPSDLSINNFDEVKNDLTELYEEQDSRLHFNAVNFQEYVKAGQGTTFILLHFWFHALIIIMHAPNVVFFGLTSPIQLLPDSRQLSMSSAKTIADILSFAEIIDPKSFIGNPFTSQPMYIAACAFLTQSTSQSSEPSSPDATSPETSESRGTKHSLLALGANQNYQMVKKSLQQLQLYWGGVKYILTALDQKSKGIWDCETYTLEEYAMTRISRRNSLAPLRRFEIPASPSAAPIAYATLTGTTNSPNSNLTRFYQNSANSNHANPSGPSQLAQFFTAPHTHHNHGQGSGASGSVSGSGPPVSAMTPPGNMIYDPIRQSLPEPPMFAQPFPRPSISAVRFTQHYQQEPQQPQPQASRPHRLSGSSAASSSQGHRQDDKPAMKFEAMNGMLEDPVVDSSPAPSNNNMVTESKLQVLAGMAHGGHGDASHQHQGASQQPSYQAPPPSYTPSSHSPTTYEPSVIQAGTSPANSLVEAATSGHQQQQLHHQQVPQGEYSPHFTQAVGGLVPGNYYPQHLADLAYQEITLELPGDNEVMPHWLDCIPAHELLGLFEGQLAGGTGSHMG